MFINLVKMLCACIGVNVSSLGNELQYKTYPAFYKVISGKDIRLTVLLAICNACKCDIIITNHSTININVNEYYKQQQNNDTSPEQTTNN